MNREHLFAYPPPNLLVDFLLAFLLHTHVTDLEMAITCTRIYGRKSQVLIPVLIFLFSKLYFSSLPIWDWYSGRAILMGRHNTTMKWKAYRSVVTVDSNPAIHKSSQAANSCCSEKVPGM